MRIAIYTDYAYTRDGEAVYADRAFALFLGELATQVDRMLVVGRVRTGIGERARYRLPEDVGFVGLPYYESLARPLGVARAAAGSVRRFWRALDDVDVCWLLGPHPLALAFATVAFARRRRVVLGVRQDLVAYARSRHPDRVVLLLAAVVLEAAYRGLARVCDAIVVGPALRRRYGGARRLLEIAVSLVRSDEVAEPERLLARPYDGELRILSVGRIDAEKNPLMLAEVLARLESNRDDRRWRLVVCGEGPLADALASRLETLGLSGRAELRGYVQHGVAMSEVYASSNVLLHVSHTEGLPQVIIEALAAGIPAVATDVGGVGEAVGNAVLLVPPDDPAAAADALLRIATQPDLRRRLVQAGVAYARTHTLEAEVERVATFLAG